MSIKGLVHLSATSDRLCDNGQIRQLMVFTHFDFTGIHVLTVQYLYITIIHVDSTNTFNSSCTSADSFLII